MDEKQLYHHLRRHNWLLQQVVLAVVLEALVIARCKRLGGIDVPPVDMHQSSSQPEDHSLIKRRFNFLLIQ